MQTTDDNTNTLWEDIFINFMLNLLTVWSQFRRPWIEKGVIGIKQIYHLFLMLTLSEGRLD